MEVSFQEAVSSLYKYKDKINVIPCIDPQYLVIDSKRDSSLIPVFFTYEDEDGFFYHGFHKAIIPDTHFYDIQSPYGYGGPIASSNDEAFLHRAWDAYRSYCKEHNVIVEFIRFHPLLENWKYHQGDVYHNRETVWIDLKVDDLIASYNENRVRTAVRKGIKNNVQITFYEPQNFLQVFKQLYYESMERLKTNSFYLFNDDYLNALCAWENAWLIVATHEEIVASVLIALVKGGILELHLFGSSEQSKKSCATNLIYHETFVRAKTNGCHTVHFGGGTSDDLNDPLLFFKLGYSNKKAQYKIGKYVHNHDIYCHLTNQWEKNTGKKPTRILFYR